MIKQPLIQSVTPVEYQFSRLTYGLSVKDSFSFLHNGIEYIICTNVTEGGLVVFQRIGSTYRIFQKLFKGWTDMWAPFVVEENGSLFIFCSDTEGLEPFWKTQKIKYFKYDLGQQALFPQIHDVSFFTGNKGRIDPEIIKIGRMYYLFYVVMDWNKGEWWDVYYSTSDVLTGPYIGEINLSQMVEHGIEEAPCVIGNQLYWSVGPSDYGSSLRRGNLILSDGDLIVNEDQSFKVAATDSLTCTHPDGLNGKLRATLKDKAGQFYIGELK